VYPYSDQANSVVDVLRFALEQPNIEIKLGFEVEKVKKTANGFRMEAKEGVVECDNTVLRQFNISRLIIQGYSFPHTDCRNVQPYTLNCVAVEPSEAVELKIAEAEVVDTAIKHTNKWIKWVKFGAEVIDPTSLLKFAWL
jgi:hypothetical protein